MKRSARGYEKAALGETAPTARHRWVAFYRLWRMAESLGPEHGHAAQLAFYILDAGQISAWVHLVMSHGDTLGLWRHLPLAMRRERLAWQKKERLYGRGHYARRERWQAQEKDIAKYLADQGVEVTPEQVAEVRRKLIELARNVLMMRGVTPPRDDAELLRIMGAKLF